MEQIGRRKQPRPLEALKLIGRSCEHRFYVVSRRKAIKREIEANLQRLPRRAMKTLAK
jgi:hypothetical protein